LSGRENQNEEKTKTKTDEREDKKIQYGRIHPFLPAKWRWQNNRHTITKTGTVTSILIGPRKKITRRMGGAVCHFNRDPAPLVQKTVKNLKTRVQTITVELQQVVRVLQFSRTVLHTSMFRGNETIGPPPLKVGGGSAISIWGGPIRIDFTVFRTIFPYFAK